MPLLRTSPTLFISRHVGAYLCSPTFEQGRQPPIDTEHFQSLLLLPLSGTKLHAPLVPASEVLGLAATEARDERGGIQVILD